MLSIIRYYGGDVSLDRLSEYTMTTRNGTDAFHLIEGAKQVGLNAKGIKCDFDYIKNNLKFPFIAHVTLGNSYQHYVVVYKVGKKNIKIMDPAKGFITLSEDDFLKIWNEVIIVLYPNKSLPIINSKNSLLLFILLLVKPFKREIIYMFFISLMITITSIIGTYYFEYIIDAINNKNNLYMISLIFLISILIKILSEYYRTKIVIYLNKRIDQKLTLETYDHILSLPYKYYKNKTTGDILTRISDLNYIKELIAEGALTIFIDIVLVVFTSIFLYIINEKLFMISIIISLIYSLIVILFNKILFPRLEKNFFYQSEVNSYLIESINNYETTKGINIKDQIYNRFNLHFKNLVDSTTKINRISNISQMLKNCIDYIGNFIILLIGALFIIDGNMTIGELVTYNAIYMYFLDPIKNIINFELIIKKGYISLKRLNELYDIEKEKLYENKVCENEFFGHICAKNLNYSYDEVNFILNNFNIEINQGDKIMILGPSGCGKSTLLKLLFKNYSCKRKYLYIDNIDINDYNLNDIRKNIKYVSQQEMLYNDTLYNNIDLFRNNSISDITSVCNLVHIDDLLNKTPFGLNMLIEENGINLSGGERQRIVLARTLLSEFKVLILDESTSQIDIKLEREIIQNIIEKYKDKTLLFVSHRDNNKDLFDSVIDFEERNGK